MTKRLFNKKQAAEYLGGISLRLLERYIEEGRLATKNTAGPDPDVFARGRRGPGRVVLEKSELDGFADSLPEVRRTG